MAGTGELPQPKYVDFGEYILFQLQRTRALIRQTDILLLLFGVVTLLLFWLLSFVLLDHWAFLEGLTQPLRWIGFGGVVATLTTGIVYFLRTSAGKHVTPLYAARTLEASEQRLGYTLLTLVDLESHQRQPRPLVRESLEKRAARALNDFDVDQAVDRRLLLKLLYALLAGTVLFLGYTLLSQKSVGDSLYRIMFPWTTAAAPTQTKILDVKPGDATVTSGSHVEVSAFIEGKKPEQVWLVYTTQDRRIVQERIPLYESSEGLGRFRGSIAGENGRGVDQPTTYHLLAGDGKTREYRLQVKAAPRARIEQLTLTPPAYTEQDPRMQNNGAIDALEGTQVELLVRTNIPVAKGWVQFYNSENLTDRAGQLPLKITDGQQLTGEWTLKIRDDGTYPRFYSVECETADGARESSPPLQAMLVRPDQRPEVRLLDPTTDLERPVNATVPLLIEAFDPDFRLSGLSIQVERRGEIISSELIDARGKRALKLTHPLELSRLPVKAGEEIAYWIEARDNRQPHANRRSTAKQKIQLIEAVSREEVEELRREDELRQQEQERQEQLRPADEDTPPTQEPPPPEDEEAEMTEERSQPTLSDQPGGDDAEESSSDSAGTRQQKESSESGDMPADSPADAPSDSEPDKDAPGQDSSPDGTGDMPDPQQPGPSRSPPAEMDDASSEDDAEGSGQQPGDSQREPKEPKLNPDGQDDDRVLEKLIERMRDQEQPLDLDPDDASGEQTEGMEQPRDDSAQPGDDSAKPDPSGEAMQDKQGADPEMPQDASTPEKTDGDKQPQEAPEDQEGMKPQPGTPGDQDQPGDQPGDKTGDKPGPGGEDQDQKSPGTADSPSGEKPSETTSPDKQPGAADQPATEPAPDSPDQGAPSPDDKPAEDAQMQDKRPADAPGEGDAKPGTGQEQGPTERDSQPDKSAPTAEKQLDRPEDGKPDGQPRPGEAPSSDDSSQGDKPSEKMTESGKPSAEEQPRDGDRQQPGKPTGDESDRPEQPADSPPPGEKPLPPGEQPTNQEGQPAMQDQEPGQGDAPGEQQPEGEPGQGAQEGEGKNEGQPPGDGPGKPGEDSGGDGDSPQPGESGQGGKQSGQGEGEASPDGEGGGDGTAKPDAAPGKARGGQGIADQANQPRDAAGDEGGEAGKSQPSRESLEDRKKAAELVLNKLEEDLKRGQVDEELLEELGWSPDNLKQFQRRMADYLRGQSAPDQPDLKQRQFDEMLRNMQLEGRRETRTGPEGGRVARDEFAPTQRPAPPEYRDLEEAFKRSLLQPRRPQRD